MMKINLSSLTKF